MMKAKPDKQIPPLEVEDISIRRGRPENHKEADKYMVLYFGPWKARASFTLMALMSFSYCLLIDDTLESATVKREGARRPE